MRRYLLMALWPAGIAAITAATAIAARRAPVSPARATRPAGTDGIGGTTATAVPARADLIRDLVRLGAMSCGGGVLSYKVMELLGPTVVNRGPVIDEPIIRWTDSHRVKEWAAVMERLGKIGNTWTTWGAAGTAAVCLGATWRKQRWLPPAVLVAAILVDHYATLAIRHRFGRPGPPTSPGGTYPSGGCDRVVLVYGLIANMLWREFSGSPRARTWAIGTVAALSYNEAYSRGYLSKHWFTDIVSGLLYGGLLLGSFLAAVRLIAGPPRPQG